MIPRIVKTIRNVEQKNSSVLNLINVKKIYDTGNHTPGKNLIWNNHQNCKNYTNLEWSPILLKTSILYMLNEGFQIYKKNSLCCWFVVVYVGFFPKEWSPVFKLHPSYKWMNKRNWRCARTKKSENDIIDTGNHIRNEHNLEWSPEL
jgi:hypothetical protein